MCVCVCICIKAKQTTPGSKPIWLQLAFKLGTQGVESRWLWDKDGCCTSPAPAPFCRTSPCTKVSCSVFSKGNFDGVGCKMCLTECSADLYHWTCGFVCFCDFWRLAFNFQRRDLLHRQIWGPWELFKSNQLLFVSNICEVWIAPVPHWTWLLILIELLGTGVPCWWDVEVFLLLLPFSSLSQSEALGIVVVQNYRNLTCSSISLWIC